MNIIMAMNMGGDDFIAKPFDLNVLMLTGFLLIFTGILAGETQFAFVRRLRPQNSE